MVKSNTKPNLKKHLFHNHSSVDIAIRDQVTFISVHAARNMPILLVRTLMDGGLMLSLTRTIKMLN